ncbi:MAG: type IV pilus biogenesis protein PilM [Candidatus Aminicenantales bacterium]
MMKLPGWTRAKSYFLEVPTPGAVFQVTSRSVTGIRISPKEKRVESRFILPLPAGAVRPALDRKNMEDPSPLESVIRNGMVQLGLSGGSASVLIPESSTRTFVLNLDSSPVSDKEREKIIRWRVGKQMPSLPDDARFAHQIFRSGDTERILVTLARASVIGEYEDVFARCRLQAGYVAPPSMSLLNFIPSSRSEAFLAVNAEEETLSLVAVIDGGVSLYRQKALSIGPEADFGAILNEVENTIHFLEDREKIRIQSLWIRPALPEGGTDLSSALQARLSLPVRETGELAEPGVSRREANIYSPLLGQRT